MTRHTNPYLLTFSDLTRAIVSVKDQLRALADAPHSLNRQPLPTDDELDAAQLPPVIEDEPNGWDDCETVRYEDAESAGTGFEEQW